MVSADGCPRGLGDFLRLVSEMLTEGVDEWTRAGEIASRGGRGPVRAEYSVSVRFGPGASRGEARREPAARPREPDVPGEPLVDVFDEGNGILVVADMPGASSDAVTLDLDPEGRVLSISAEGPQRRYECKVPLPRPARFDRREVSYREGILRVWLSTG